MNQLATAIRPGVQSRPTVILLHRLPTRLRLGVPVLRAGQHPPGNGVPPLPILPETRATSQLGPEETESSLAERVETAVGAVEGIIKVKANPLTGTLLVEHDGAPGREAAILSALYSVLPATQATFDKSRLLTDLKRAAMTLDRATLRASNGWVDLKTVLSLLLGIYGLNRLLTEPSLRLPSGLTMVWWAYNSLRQLARESRG